MVLTLLHKSKGLVKSLFPANHVVPALSQHFWLNLLSESQDDLSKSRPLALSIAPVDKLSPSRDLVTAILDQPFASDPALSNALRTRQNPPTLSISYARSLNSDSGLALPSSFFLQFPYDVHIREYNVWSDFLSDFLRSDIPVVVCNPITTSPSHILDTPLLRDYPNTILVVVASPTDEVANHVKAQYPDVNILLMDPSRAVAGLDSLHTDPSSPAAVQRYQDEFGASRVFDLTAHIKTYLESKTKTKTPLHTSQHLIPTKAALARLSALYSLSRSQLRAADAEVDSIREAVSSLQRTIAEELVKAKKDILGVYEVPTESTVSKALSQARRDVHKSMNSLTWWKALWRIDEISSIVTSMVHNAWCKDLEAQLIFHTGRLSLLERQLTDTSFSILSRHSEHFNSPVLKNALEQVRPSRLYPLSAYSLTAPLHERRSQLNYPTTRLHVAGQQAAVGMGGSIAAGVGLGWAGWLGWLTGAEHTLLQMNASTATATGLFMATLGISWSMWKWERSKKLWWRDWDRVCEGLDRDMTATLTKVVQENVAVVADRTCKGLTELASKRRDEISTIRDELDRLQKDLGSIQQR
ncbi:hypothetical protein D9758_001821 [Tetrapyrgos nigripes]|uniref:Uncharacterized protein n=1 Tax=Tetrapyrgos nigripes TaxID=182062 RepID=A0A8H5GT69_9AGAR|nr:hypothetical protein D9758_001821 [Tetrapyrgos nigripes]